MQLNASAKGAFVLSTGSNNRLSSLFSLLSPSCSTKRGRQCLKQWLEQPCIDPVELNRRHATVDAVISAVDQGNAVLWDLSSIFQHFQSYERELSVFTCSTPNSMDTKLSLSDFTGLQKWLREFQVLARKCVEDGEFPVQLEILYSTRLRPIQLLCSQDLEPFCTSIQDMQDAMEIDSENEMRASTSHLQEIRRQISQCEVKVTVAVKQTATLLSIAEDRIKVIYADDDQSSMAKLGIVLRVSRQDSHRIQQHSGEHLSVIRASRASGVWFSTPMIDSLGAKWKALKRNYEDAEADLVDFLTTEFRSRFQCFLHELERRVAELDVLVSFALVSHKRKFVRASIAAENISILSLRGLFNPFTQNLSSESDEVNSDVTIELSEKTFLLLEGDQKKGDCSLLQLVGLVAMLNQLGCFVPCKEAVIPVFDAMFLRTGAHDQQLYGYSTFMTEMREMSQIFASMTSNSLVVIEDLCRGTSTSEGLALAVAMCLYLMESKTLTCFSSQWRELTDQLSTLSACTTPDWSHQNTNIDPNKTPKAAFKTLMRDCDLPPDLITLINEEINQS
ncbi:MutS domain V [Phytophthora infestans]|uniref:MutS domain V n=1 Tax=Phytophthora infestans TaxID=4787 RepID=A0A833WCS2_PHYIN|nr:MutS domain V [Phytophthora infestans]